MPIKSRIIEEKLKELVNRRIQFENELETVRSELETPQNSVIKGLSDTDTLVSKQIRVNAIEQTITRFDSNIAALEAEFRAQKRIEKKREIVSGIKTLDDEAEKAGSRFVKLYSDVENLSYARFAEMFVLRAKIDELKLAFSKQLAVLIPEVYKLKSRDLPEVETELNNLLEELKTTCKLGVLRSDKVFSSRSYVADDFHAFRLPENDLESLIWLSIQQIGERQAKQQIPLPNVESGFFSRVLERMS